LIKKRTVRPKWAHRKAVELFDEDKPDFRNAAA
jgi:hypothetical protein